MQIINGKSKNFGPVLENLYEEFAAGTIDQTEFKKRLNLYIEEGPGDSVKNLKKLTGVANEDKRKVVAAKNRSLEKLEAANPSARYTPE